MDQITNASATDPTLAKWHLHVAGLIVEMQILEWRIACGLAEEDGAKHTLLLATDITAGDISLHEEAARAEPSDLPFSYVAGTIFTHTAIDGWESARAAMFSLAAYVLGMVNRKDALVTITATDQTAGITHTVRCHKENDKLTMEEV